MFNQHSLFFALIIFGYSLGVLYGFYNPTWLLDHISYVLGAACLVLLLLYYSRKERYAFWAFCFLLSSFMGLVRMGLISHSQESNLENSPEKQLLWVQLEQELKSSATQQRFEALGHPLMGGKLGKPGKIILSTALDSTQKPWKTGEAYWTSGYLSKPSLPRAPGQFNYRDYLKKQGIQYQWYATKGVRDQNYQSKQILWLEKIQRFKKRLLQKIETSNMPAEAFQLYAALLFGDKKGLESELLSSYQQAGAVHILAISGLHIGVIAGLILLCLQPLSAMKGGRTISGLTLVVCLWAYAAFTGFSPSVIRAVSMASFLGLSLFINRPQYSIQLLGVAFLVNVIWDPLALFSLGFCMSYSAVFFILLGMPFFNEAWSPKNSLLKIIWPLIGVSLCAQMGVLAWSLFAFNQLPLLFMLSNLSVIPFLGVILGGGLVLAIWYAIANPPALVISSYAWVLGALNQIIQWIGGQETWVLKNIYFPWPFIWGTLAFCLGILAATYPYRTYKNRGTLVLLGGLILCSIWIFEFKKTQQTQRHYFIGDQTQTALVVLGNNQLVYWSKDSLSNPTLSHLKRAYPFHSLIKKEFSRAFYLQKKSVLWSPKAPTILEHIDYMIIDSDTQAYPNQFRKKQLKNTQFIFSSYAQTMQMHVWKKWVQKNARSTWWLNAQGYYTFKEISNEQIP